jgi:hypothetical protein
MDMGMDPRAPRDADQDAGLEAALRASFRVHFGAPPDVAALWSRMDARPLPARDAPRRLGGSFRAAFARLMAPVAPGVPGRRRRVPFPRVALAAVLLLLVLGATAYGAVALLHPLLRVPVAQGRHYTRVGQTQRAGDITVVVDQAVADADWIIIGVAGERPCAIPVDACRFSFDPVLLTVDGAPVAAGAIESDGTYRPGRQEEASVLYYRPPKRADGSSTLHLHLELQVLLDGQHSGQVVAFDITLPNHTMAHP